MLSATLARVLKSHVRIQLYWSVGFISPSRFLRSVSKLGLGSRTYKSAPEWPRTEFAKSAKNGSLMFFDSGFCGGPIYGARDSFGRVTNPAVLGMLGQ